MNKLYLRTLTSYLHYSTCTAYPYVGPRYEVDPKRYVRTIGEYLQITWRQVPDAPKTIEISTQRPIYSVSFIEDGKQVLSGGVEGMLRRWRVDDGYEVGPAIRAEGARIFAADISADRKWLVCGARRLELSDGRAEVRVWDTQTHKKVFDINGHTDTVFSVNISPDSRKFATGSADKLAFIWSMATGKRLVGPLRHNGVVVAVRFSPNGDRIATVTAKNPDTTPLKPEVIENVIDLSCQPRNEHNQMQYANRFDNSVVGAYIAILPCQSHKYASTSGIRTQCVAHDTIILGLHYFASHSHLPL